MLLSKHGTAFKANYTEWFQRWYRRNTSKYSLRLRRFKTLANTIQTEIKNLVSLNNNIYTYFRQTNFAQIIRFGAYGEITTRVNTLQNCPAHSANQYFNSPLRRWSIVSNVTGKGLWFVHIGLFRAEYHRYSRSARWRWLAYKST